MVIVSGRCARATWRGEQNAGWAWVCAWEGGGAGVCLLEADGVGVASGKDVLLGDVQVGALWHLSLVLEVPGDGCPGARLALVTGTHEAVSGPAVAACGQATTHACVVRAQPASGMFRWGAWAHGAWHGGWHR